MTSGGQPRRGRRTIRQAIPRVLVAVVGGALLVLGAGAPGAQAAEGYRYWSFWDRDGDSWVYATKGPGLERPADGDVHGVRFAVSEESGGGPRPRGAAGFDAICGGTPPGDGGKRVALVLDFGTAADAPGGRTPPPARTECASVAEDATLGDALAAVAEPLRYDSNGLLCAIDGYPRSGCAEPAASDDGAGAGEARDKVDISTVPADEADDGDSGPSTGTVGGLVMVAVLAGLTVWQLRRRRT
ncbi:hypothetical protein AA958_07780 [Streptomyces sp. CNQ-509]|nr:hypothetical protein AA958_07780 [Streptomyces sp. CNQ-509]